MLWPLQDLLKKKMCVAGSKGLGNIQSIFSIFLSNDQNVSQYITETPLCERERKFKADWKKTKKT